MSKVGIVTDTTNCLLPELIEEYDIRVVPYHVIIEGKDYRDQIDITPAEFYRIFPTLKQLPTTSAVSPGDYANIFTELAKTTDSIACLIISKALSAAFSSAEEARDIVKSENPHLNIELIDTKNSVGALGFVVLEAARAAQAGKSLAEVVSVAQALIPRVKYIASFDTLKYLIKGGRAPKTAIIGELLNIRPFIGLVDDSGVVSSLGKERGKRKAFNRLVEMVKEHADVTRPLHLMVHYSGNIEDGELLREMVVSRYNPVELFMTELTPVMTTHTGPSVGLSFYS